MQSENRRVFNYLPSSNITVTPLSVTDALEFPAEMGEGEKNVEHYLLQHLGNAKSDTLEQFLIFATGAKSPHRVWSWKNSSKV